MKHGARGLVCALAVWAGCADDAGDAGGVTYHRDVKPIMDARCAGCHVEGGIGPFPLTSYEAAAAAAQIIPGPVLAREMPPWPPDGDCNEYLHDRSLTQEQPAGRGRRAADAPGPRLGRGLDRRDVPGRLLHHPRGMTGDFTRLADGCSLNFVIHVKCHTAEGGAET